MKPFKKLLILISTSLLLTGCKFTTQSSDKKENTSESTSDTGSSGSDSSGGGQSDTTSSGGGQSTEESSGTTGSSDDTSGGGDVGYYSQCAGLSGNALAEKLKSFNSAKTPSYDWSRYEAADEALDDSSSVLCIYTRHNIPKANHCGSYDWNNWNREHVWTQTAYPKSKTDNHNIFACEGQINNIRNNFPYAEGGSYVTVHGHTTECKFTGSTFEPCDDAKGEIARSVMYGTVHYSYTMTNIIDSVELCLKWHLEHPITERDTIRNDVVYGLQGNRNPFVDHPEYACKIWGNTNSKTKQLCGM